MASSGGRAGFFLICRVGAKLCALPLQNVLETMRPLASEPLAHVAEFVAGLALIRGRPTPVLDARKLLGSAANDAPGRYITLDLGAHGTRVAALAVDAVVGVRSVLDRELAELPALLRTQEQIVGGVATLDAELLLVLEQSRIVSDELWERLQRGRAEP